FGTGEIDEDVRGPQGPGEVRPDRGPLGRGHEVAGVAPDPGTSRHVERRPERDARRCGRRLEERAAHPAPRPRDRDAHRAHLTTGCGGAALPTGGGGAGRACPAKLATLSFSKWIVSRLGVSGRRSFTFEK